MFEESLIESSQRFRNLRVATTTALCFVLQTGAVAVALVIPLFVTHVVPAPAMLTDLVAPLPTQVPVPPPPPAAHHRRASAETEATRPVRRKAALVRPVSVKMLGSDDLRIPTGIPHRIEIADAELVPPAVAGMGNDDSGTLARGVLGATPIAMLPKLATPKKIRVSEGVEQGLLINEVVPDYPAEARNSSIQGPVVLQASISKEGKIENLKVVSGHHLLAMAAARAIKQWRYKPYLLDGEPVEVETTIEVDFVLKGAS
jgi:periplasmic protein TonB